jgi:Uma2 family endonuclease
MSTVIMPTWQELCDDPHLRDLPYKIEQDRYGRIVMSPARTKHGRYQIRIGSMLEALLPGWAVFAECAIETSDGVRVPDVAAMTGVRARLYLESASLPESPEICVEVLSLANTSQEMDEKRRLYAGKGCREFWTCSEQGEMIFLDAASGERLGKSAICPEFPPLIRLD